MLRGTLLGYRRLATTATTFTTVRSAITHVRTSVRRCDVTADMAAEGDVTMAASMVARILNVMFDGEVVWTYNPTVRTR